MKIFFTFSACLCIGINISANAQGRLVLANSATINSSQNTTIVLNNFNVANNSLFSQTFGNGTVKITGSLTDTISGNQLQINSLTLAKTKGQLLLQTNLAITSAINFGGGLFNIGNNTINLGTNGKLIGESETSRIITSGNGYVQSSGYLNAPANINLGNLGSVISSPQNLGLTIIQRGNKPLTGEGLVNAIGRYYSITPAYNSALHASLAMYYFNAELQGAKATDLSIFKDSSNNSWVDENAIMHAESNYAEAQLINNFSTFTLAEKQNTLPLIFTNFTVNCNNAEVNVYWQTAQQVNVHYFEVQSKPVNENTDEWKVLATKTAQNENNQTQNYTVNVGKPTGVPTEYRIAEYDNDGKINYTGIKYTDCLMQDVMAVYPNPVVNNVAVTIYSVSAAKATLVLYDAKGAAVLQRQISLSAGYNNVTINMASLAKGAYVLQAGWLQNTHTATLIKN